MQVLGLLKKGLHKWYFFIFFISRLCNQCFEEVSSVSWGFCIGGLTLMLKFVLQEQHEELINVPAVSALLQSIRDSFAEDRRGICKYRYWNGSWGQFVYTSCDPHAHLVAINKNRCKCDSSFQQRLIMKYFIVVSWSYIMNWQFCLYVMQFSLVCKLMSFSIGHQKLYGRRLVYNESDSLHLL